LAYIFIDLILFDEKAGFKIAEMFNLTPVRTTSIIMLLLDKKVINLKTYKELLKKLLESGYFIDALTYQKLLSIRDNL